MCCAHELRRRPPTDASRAGRNRAARHRPSHASSKLTPTRSTSRFLDRLRRSKTDGSCRLHGHQTIAVPPKDASSLACQTRRSATSWASSSLTTRRSTSRFSRPPQGEGFLSGRRRLPRRFPSSSPAAGVPDAAAWPRAILPPGFSVPDERATSSAFRLAGSGDTRTV